ncbi:hypothetical protein DFH08DRAFT_887217, partial [Mycena albidolilacea]
MLFPHHPYLSCSLSFAFFSLVRSTCFPPLPMFVLLTFSCLLVSSLCGSVCFSPITHFVLLALSHLLIS